MVSVPLSRGEHRVELIYRNQAFAIGWKVSLGCMVVLMILTQLIYKPNWKDLFRPQKGKFQK